MEGYGIYIYADGVRYDGEYKNDRKEGYGVYYWPDGRKYDGWWHKGKQHGVGAYFDPKKGAVKYGMWEHGQRLKWFDEVEVKQINAGELDFAQLFKQKESDQFVRKGANLKKPDGFDAKMKEVKDNLKINLEKK